MGRRGPGRLHPLPRALSPCHQLEPHGVRVNAITPGATGSTGTPMAPDEREDMLARFPLGLAGPRPTADAVRYLLDASGDWISGAVLNVSGGQFRGI